MQPLRGIGIGLILFFTSYLGVIFMQGPFYLLHFVSPTLFRQWIDLTMTMWLIFTGSMLQWVGAIRVRQFGEEVRPGERALLLLNHRTRLDFMYLWAVLSRFGTCSQEKIVLKSGLDKIPGAGWAMQFAGFIFLRRKWETDAGVLSDYITYFNKVGPKLQLLLFPEGTDLDGSGLARSHKYAEKMGLRKYNFVLHPRTTGFQHIVHMMEQEGGLDAIYDITVGYPLDFPHSELELAKGRVPPEVHYTFKRYSRDELPLSSEEELGSWLTTLWAEKESFLENYYAGEKVFDNELHCEVSAFVERGLAVYWALFVSISLYSICSSWFVFLYFVFANIVGIYFSFMNNEFYKLYMRPVLGSLESEKKKE